MQTEALPEYLRGYSRAQLRVILESAAVKQVVAAAGSGKTRTVIGLIEHTLRKRPDDRRRILLLSFSRRAVGELRQRLPADLTRGVEISTFHSFCFRWLTSLDPTARRSGGVRLITEEDKQEFMRALLAGETQTPAGDNQASDADPPELDVGGIPFALLFKDPARFRRQFPEVAFEVFRRFYAYKRESGLLEYEDLVQRMLAGLRQGVPGVETLRARYQMIVVDEFQDTDPQQLEFLRLMNPPRLTVVGDDWQAIYAFRGATVAPFLNFRDVFAGVRIFRLAENYRSLRPIVRLGNRLIRASRRQLRKRVRAVRGPGPGLPVLAYAIAPGQESRLLPFCADLGPEFRILVRTNFRRQRWLLAGFAPEQVLTIHKAKGLEFPVVFVDLIGGWSESDPGGGGNSTAGSSPPDEEVRVLYVAASRAENLLVILRNPFARNGAREEWYWKKLCEPNRVREVQDRALRKWLGREAEYRKSR